MAIPILNHMDFQKAAEIQNVLLHTTGSGDVSSPGTGQIIYDSGAVKVYNGSAWLTLASGGGTRVVAVDTNGDGSVNNTLELSENLVLKKGSGVSLSEAGGVVTIAATGTQLTAEQVEDMVGGMLDGTETGISVSYDDTNGNLDFVIGAGDIVHSMLADDSVDVDNLASNAVVTASIVDANVTTAKIADDNVTYAKIQNVAANNVLLGNDDGAGSGIQELTKANVLTLLNVEDGATADQSNAEIRAAVEAATDSNVFTDADHTKLNAIEASADVTDATNVTAAGALMDSEVTDLAGVKGVTISTLQVKPSEGAFANGDKTKLDGIEASADVTDTANVKTALNASFGGAGTIGDASDTFTIPGNLIVSGTQTVQNETIQVVENNTIQFEGATADAHEVKLTAADATADRTITLPNVTGHVALLAVAATETITSTPAELNLLDGITTLSGSNTGDEPDASTTVKGIIEIADTGEAQAGTSDVVALTPAKLADTRVTATIDVSDSNFTSNLYAEVAHNLGSEDISVQLFDSSSKETVYADVARTDKANSASNNKIKITFASAPANDIEVLIASIQGATAGSVAYA